MQSKPNRRPPLGQGKQSVQLILAVVLSLAGLVLLFLGFYMPPKGTIESSVLIAYGEVSTFAGALLGLDYHYRYRYEE